jgi:hypothetical protein
MCWFYSQRICYDARSYDRKKQICSIQEVSKPQIPNDISRKQTNTYLPLSHTSQLEIFALLGCRAALDGSWLSTFRENIYVLFSTVNQLKCLPTPCNIPEERKPQLRCGGRNQSPISSSHTLKNKFSLVNNSTNGPNTRRDYKEKQQID